MAEKSKNMPLRDWAEQSYGTENGRAVSSLEGRGNMGNHAKGSGRQIPSINGRDKSQSLKPVVRSGD